MDLEKFLPYQLSVLSNKVSSGIAKYYREQYGISVAQWRVLVLLSDTGNQTAKELTQKSQMDKVRVSRTMKSLLTKKLIREKTCKQDARARRYNLTQYGKQLINEVNPKALTFEKELISSLSKDEIKTFQNSIEVLNKQVDKIILHNS
jgi:DNA-binding MarR family transcriptional regulator